MVESNFIKGCEKLKGITYLRFLINSVAVALIMLLIGAVGGYEYYKFSKKARAQKMESFWSLLSKI